MTVPFPLVIDSSLLSAWRSCRRKAWLEYLQHWKPAVQSVHLHAGGAFARGLEVAREAYYVKNLPPQEAIARGIGALLSAYGSFDCPEDSAKSATRMAGALEYYFSVWPLDRDTATPIRLPDGGRAIEFSFLEPLEISHPETGDPILYAGRFDMVVDYQGGVFGEDDKTTSQLGASWARQWDLRSQFTSYCWGARSAGLKLNGFLVRGVSILKTKYDHAEAITYRPQWMVDEWYENTLQDVADMIEEWKIARAGGRAWRKNLDHACTEYGGCLFRKVCTSPEPDRWLAVDFQRRRWDPVTRVETVL